MQLSYNKIRTFGECALKYRLAYLERLPRPPVASLAFHRRLHAALAKYHFYARRDGRVNEQTLLDAYAEIAGAIEDPAVRDSRAYRDGEEILRRYCETENRLQRVPAYLEHRLRVEFGPHVLTGTVDRLDFTPTGGYSLIDYKLDRALPEANAAETSKQLSFYDLLVYEGLGVAPDDVRLYYLRHGVEQVSARSRADRRETVEWVGDTAARIDAETRWEPTEGEGCRACAFQAHCPAKTGQERAHAPVWQQGQLLWGADEPEPAAARAVVRPAGRGTAAPAQTTLDSLFE